MEITITEEAIAKACGCSNSGLFQWDVVKSQWEDKINGVLVNGKAKAKTTEMSSIHRMYLKILSECIFQKGGGIDHLSLDHKVVLYCLASFEKINLPKYILYYMCWAIREGQKNERRQIPYGRLLSVIFVQGRLLNYLKNYGVSSDEELGTVTGKIINGRTLQFMNIIKEFHPHNKDLKESTVQSDLMKDFPLISKEDNPEVLYQFITAHFKETGEIISYASIPGTMGGAPLKIKWKRTKIIEKEDAPAPKSKRAKVAKTEASSAPDTIAPEGSKKRRIKGIKDIKEAVKEATEEWVHEENGEEEEHTLEPRKKKAKKPLEIVSPMMILAPAAEFEEQAVKEATGMLQEALKKGKGISEDIASESASGALLSGKSSDLLAHVNSQTLSSSPSSSSSSTDLDDIPLSQHYKKPLPKSKTTKTSNLPQTSSLEPSNIDERTISLSERRIEVCKRLSADHPFEPPIIQTLNVIQPSSEPSPSQPSSNIPQPSSPSTLFSLEKHLGGEMSVTLQKASKIVPKKIVLENQQPPSPIIEEEPEGHIQFQNQPQNDSETQPEIINQRTIQNEIILEQQIASDQPSTSQTIIIP
ncbi:hypothetical protein MtrunA17_Chr6g0468941 [Medicago truncatula]|uniref:Uncharacterized protein n=1 Tax=Medicago truncatula TaxID=3880 RepID=A0A396HFW7_MEDTR|nr:hypothetical protein MtrunA17_Chr6g0468941 [Medicago truncatula]